MPEIPKYTLAIETATLKGSLSLLKGAEEAAFWIGDNYQMLSAALLPQISALLSENHLTAKDIDLIAVSAGPGSFTGVRIGLSIAKALNTALGIPAVAISLPEALALSAGDAQNKIVTIIPAGRDEVYWQEFTRNEQGPAAVSPVAGVINKRIEEIPEISGLSGMGAFLIATSDVKPESIQTIEERAGGKVHIAPDGLAKYIGMSAINGIGRGRDEPGRLLIPLYVKEFRS